MRKFIGLTLLLATILFGVVGSANAVDGFSEPVYKGTPTIHQTEWCDAFGTKNYPTDPPCFRWVRDGGTFMQGPQSQMIHETDLTYEVCTEGWTYRTDAGSVWWKWIWYAPQPFGHSYCYVINSITGYEWSRSAWLA